jgi:hypothetical protein
LDSSLTLAPPLRATVADLQGSASFDINTNWNPDMSFEPWDFENMDLWNNLATHPTIAGMEGRA